MENDSNSGSIQTNTDNDIKNEILELANRVSEEFPNEQADVATYESFKLLDTKFESVSFNDDDFQLPQVDWENLEAKLKLAQEEITSQNKRANINNDRDEIRRKLAIVSSSSSSSFNDQYQHNSDNYISDYFRRPSLSKNHLIGQNLQICFMNEAINDESIDNESLPPPSSDNGLSPMKNYQSNIPNSNSTFSVLSISSDDSCDSVLSQLQNEAKQALAKVPSQVRVKMQSDFISNKNLSPIADIVGLPTYGLKRLEREHIVDMNIGQLQVIVNDLCNQIEKINEDLKKLLIDRDDFYMQQDSILVDIEDVTKRIKEYVRNDSLIKANHELRFPDTASHLSKSNAKMSISEKVGALLHQNTNSEDLMIKTNAINTENNSKSKFFHLGSFTNKLYRFTKKS